MSEVLLYKDPTRPIVEQKADFRIGIQCITKNYVYYLKSLFIMD